MSIWTTATSSPVLDTPLGTLSQQQQQHQHHQQQQHQQNKTDHRKSSSTSINNQQQNHNHKTQSSPGSLANILGNSGHLINHSPSGAVTAHSNNAIHIGVAVGAASTLASSIDRLRIL